MTNPRQRQQGNMLLSVSALFIAVLLLGLSANVGYWVFQRSLISDAVAALAKPILKNQLIYRERQQDDPAYPTTEAMVETTLAEIDPPFEVTVDFNFWRGEEGEEPVFVGSDPDPALAGQGFNIARVQICTPLADVAGLFTLPTSDDGQGGQICTVAEAFIPDEDCLCEGPLSSAVDEVVDSVLDRLLDALTGFTCKVLGIGCPKTSEFLDDILDQGTALVCDVENTTNETVRFVSTLLHAVVERDPDSLDAQPLLEAVDCLLEETVVTVDTALVGLLGPDFIRVHYRDWTLSGSATVSVGG